MAKRQAVTQVNLDVASLNSLKIPTQWTDGQGRCTRALITEAVRLIFRGSRDGMLRKMSSPVLETRCGEAGGASTAAYKGDRSRGGPYQESEGFIVSLEGLGQHNPARGKGPCFIHETEVWMMRGLQRC